MCQQPTATARNRRSLNPNNLEVGGRTVPKDLNAHKHVSHENQEEKNGNRELTRIGTPEAQCQLFSDALAPSQSARLCTRGCRSVGGAKPVRAEAWDDGSMWGSGSVGTATGGATTGTSDECHSCLRCVPNRCGPQHGAASGAR
jgi:hypothetical protein